MNSWKSTLLSACAPPLSTFIIGTGSTPRGLAAEVAPQREALLGRLRVRGRQRHAEDRVGPEARLVGGAVELDQGRVETALIGGVEAGDRRGDLAVDVRDRTGDALAPPALAAVAQLLGLELARRGPGGHRCVAVRARAQADLDLDRGVAAAVEDLAGVDALDLAHRSEPPGRILRARFTGSHRGRSIWWCWAPWWRAPWSSAPACSSSGPRWSPWSSSSALCTACSRPPRIRRGSRSSRSTFF